VADTTNVEAQSVVRQSACAQCNTPFEPGDVFCLNCGTRVNAL
jgi:uncharacterized Zn finger protein (UPF0148 family)